MTELNRWIHENNPPASCHWSRGFWDYCHFLRRLMAKYEVQTADVVGTYLEQTPPPTEELLMPVVRILFPGALVVVQFSFARVPETWTISMVTAEPYRQPTYGLFDEDVDVRRIGAPGFPEDMFYPPLRASPGRWTCQVHDEWDLAMLVQLVLHRPQIPEEVAEAQFVGLGARPEIGEEKTIWVAGPTFRRCTANTVEAALGMALVPADRRLDDLEWSGSIFGVRDGFSMLYPAFQFDTAGHPLPIFSRLIHEIHSAQPRASSLHLAYWLVAHTQTLHGARPLDLVHQRPEAVIDALRQDLLGRRDIPPEPGDGDSDEP